MLAAANTTALLVALLPELLLMSGACAVLLLAQSVRAAVVRSVPWVALATVAAAVLLLEIVLPMIMRAAQLDEASIGVGLQLDSLARFVRLSALILGVLIVLAVWSAPTTSEQGEFFCMLLLSIAGMLLVGMADNLVVLFLGLELVSIPTYVIVSMSRWNRVALEAGTKYFYLGALSAAIMAYGFSLLYGAAGTAALEPAATDRLIEALHKPGTLAYGITVMGLLLGIGGLLFKVAAVPFHFYIADVYQGAAGPVAGMLGFVPKLAGFVAIVKILSLTGWQIYSGGLFWFLWLVAIASMTVGNLLALRQTNIKRMLAYSGIAHSGYMLVGLMAGHSGGEGVVGDGVAAILYYVVIYGLANLAAFTVLALLRMKGQACETLRDVAGLLRRHPSLALLLALTMFTLMGMPPTPGFWGKLGLFGSALSAGTTAGAYQPWLVGLVIVAVVNSAIAAAYYLRVIAALLLYESDEPADVAPREAERMGATICGFLILFFSFYPSALLGAGRSATSDLRDLLVSKPQTVQPVARTPVGSPPSVPAGLN